MIKTGRPAYIFIEGPTPKITQFVQRLTVLQLFNSTEVVDVKEGNVGGVGGVEGAVGGAGAGGRKWLQNGDAWCVVDNAKQFKNRLKGVGLGVYGVRAFEDEERVLKKVHAGTKLIGKMARRERARAYELKRKEAGGTKGEEKKKREGKKDDGKKKEAKKDDGKKDDGVRGATVEKLAAM